MTLVRCLGLCGLFFSALWLVQRDVQAEQPNVIVILADDLGWADLNCYGSTFHRTPSLDLLAQSGAKFTQGYASCPVCSPTRAALLTGKWPARLHLTDWLPGRADRPDQMLLRPEIRQELDLSEVTLAELFREADYVTGHIGKWHLGGEGFSPLEQGFQTNIGGDHTGTPLSYFAPYERNGHFMPGLEEAPAGEYLTDRYGREAEKFIETNRDRPFFLHLSHNAVHTPMKAREDLIKRYELGSAPPGQQSNPIYAAMLESLDSSVGRVVKTLERTGLKDRTIIVFTSDNGGLATKEGPNTPATSNSPLREGKGWLYEGGIRVPLIVSWPGKIAAGKVVETPASSIDVLPTLVELCGLAAPKGVDGISLKPVLLEPAGTLERDAMYWHYPHYANQGGKPGGVIRQGNWKLIEFYENGRRELYDVQKDPRELQNVADKHSEQVASMAAALEAWRELVGAQRNVPNPNYVPHPPGKEGTIELPARGAEVHGAMLRFEPLPHKNTLGFWTRAEDWASWELTVEKPGTYALEGEIGCGAKSGGSEVAFEVAGQTLKYTVAETGGFQMFVATPLGQVRFDAPGRYTLTVRAVSKPGPAVMDLRQLTLKPVP